MARTSKAWHYIDRICNAMNANSEEMYQKGREFLRYYREICCVPEYALSPEPADSSVRNRRVFLDKVDSICGATMDEMGILLEDDRMSPMQLKGLVSETVMRLNNNGGYGTIYWEIITRKYLEVFPMTDAEIWDLMTISDTTYYCRHKEACAYFMLTMMNTVLPRMRKELQKAEEEERIQPREVLYG